MTSAIEQIEKELAQLSEAVQTLAEDLRRTDTDYLSALGQSVRQQFILACYYLCTQGYPEAFLKLSFSQRQNLQQELQKLAQETETSLKELANLDFFEVAKREKIQTQFMRKFRSSAEINELIQPEDKSRVEEEKFEEMREEDEDEDFSEEETQEIHLDLKDIQLELSVLIEKSLDLAESEEEIEEQAEESGVITPEVLGRWQGYLEGKIQSLLKQLSRDGNLTLQRFGILPQRLPEKILEVASKVDPPQEAIVGPPNLLQLMVETEDPQEPERGKVTRLMAVHLRLSEIEFTDATVSAWRNQLRSLLGRLNSLKRDYRKKHRERSILEAEAAWRSSWFNQ